MLARVDAAEMPALRAGAAVADITPREFPVNMPGGCSANAAERAHDPRHARALVLDDGTTQLAMVVIDSLGSGPETLDEVKKIAAEKTGLAPERMLIRSTHTHTGASGEAFRQILVAGTADAIVRAHAALRPAALGAAAHPLPDEPRGTSSAATRPGSARTACRRMPP
jgi:hypothetical protein